MVARKKPDGGGGSSRSLREYRAKRRFDRTPEPAGGAKERSGPGLRRTFCVQKHLASHLHYDLRLEHKGVLLSWAVPKGPSLNPADRRLAMMVEDHPLEYAEFEGVIPEGYGAGLVMLWDLGTWSPHPDFSDVDAALRKGELKFELDGYKLKGSWVLVRIGGDRSWLLIKHRDQWAGPVDISTEAPLSVKSGRDFPEILAAAEPDIWKSDRPSEGSAGRFAWAGAAGRMLKEIIEKAAELRANPRTPTSGRGTA